MKLLTSRLLSVILIFLFKILFSSQASASSDNQFITIVNPVRISKYTQSPDENIKSQYSVISSNQLPATWLLTYDVLISSKMIDILKTFDKRQEVGIFMEVTPNFAKDAHVEYHNTGFWHHATSLFLSGYKQEERKKLIDTVFEKFRQDFGYYPTSVGAWSIDAYSLNYMKEKYSITANLGVSDQFATDGYKVWGQYWSTPFYPSKYHSVIPADDLSVKLDIVNIQWAPRDPLNGYFNSYFSMQDYLQNPVGEDTRYFEKLILLYAKKHDNLFGHTVVGLESDLSPEVYEGEYARQMEAVKKFFNQGDFKLATMKAFAEWYRNNFPNLSPPHLIETDDLLGKSVKVIWYQSPNYRVGINYDFETKQIKIFDLRTYHGDFQEPYFIQPNKEFNLSIYIPSYFDEINNPADVWKLEAGNLETEINEFGGLDLRFEKGNISLRSDAFLLGGFMGEIPRVLSQSPALVVGYQGESIKVVPKKNWIIGRGGYIFPDLTDTATHELLRKRTILILIIGSIVFLSLSFYLIFSKLSERLKLIMLSLLIFPLLVFFHLWYQDNSMQYYVSQGEIDALYRLSIFPQGKVVVYDKECLGCLWHSLVKPAVFANKRSYVQRWGKHPIVYNASVFEAKNQEEARLEFEKLGAKYIYLAKYEDYIEKTPFSPGDLGIEKVYENANAEVWMVK